MADETPCAEPHAGCCGGWRLETSGYPIMLNAASLDEILLMKIILALVLMTFMCNAHASEGRLLERARAVMLEQAEQLVNPAIIDSFVNMAVRGIDPDDLAGYINGTIQVVINYFATEHEVTQMGIQIFDGQGLEANLQDDPNQKHNTGLYE